MSSDGRVFSRSTATRCVPYDSVGPSCPVATCLYSPEHTLHAPKTQKMFNNKLYLIEVVKVVS